MSREWKPGDVAVIEGPWMDDRVRVALIRRRKESAGESLEFAYAIGGFDMVDDLAPSFTARPLVVIDPEDREQVERLREAASMWADRVPHSDMREEGDLTHLDAMQAALRSLITPPRPKEPTGLGAVVEDVNGELFIRDKTTTTVAHWKRARGEDRSTRYRYEELCGIARVLSEGVTP